MFQYVGMFVCVLGFGYWMSTPVDESWCRGTPTIGFLAFVGICTFFIADGPWDKRVLVKSGIALTGLVLPVSIRWLLGC